MNCAYRHPPGLRAVAVAAALGAAVLVLAGGALAATPDEGEVGPDAPTTSWQGRTYVTSNPGSFVDSSLGCRAPTRIADPACDIFHLTVAPPSSGLYAVEFQVDGNFDSDDFDLFVFDANGDLVGLSTTPSGDERVALHQLPAGTYEVVVEAWLVNPGSTYQGSAALDTAIEEAEVARKYHGTPVPPGFEGRPQNALIKGGQPLGVRATYVGREAAEPTVGVTANGTAFYAAGAFDALPEDSPRQLARTEILRSRDGGRTWVSVQPDLPPPASTEPPTTLDPYVYVEEDTGRVFSIDLYVGCSYLIWTDDEGETWQRNPLACGDMINDHMTIYAGPPPAGSGLETQGFPEILYYCFNRVADSSCGRSLDGGQTFEPTRDPAYLGIDEETGEFCGGLHAHASTDGAGRLFLPKGHCDIPTVAISEDGGDSWTRVSFGEHVVAADHEVNVAVDSEDNLYAVWWDARDRLPYLSTSTDHGRTWSTPLMIAPPEVQEVNFPTIAAGDRGRIAISFPGAPIDAPGDLRRPWNYYVVVSTDALTENPLFTYTVANPRSDPIHRGNCGPGRCAGMFDFLDIVVSPHDGTFWATATDTCTGTCVTQSTEADAMDGMIVVQTKGPSLWEPGPRHKR